MKIKLAFLLFLFIGTFSFNANAQSAKKLAGTWQQVAKKGNDPCAIDVRLELKEKGPAAIHYGKRFSECDELTTKFDSWEIKKQGDSGRGKSNNFISLKSESETVNFLLETFKGDIMKVLAEVRSGDSTTSKALIFKRMK